MITIITKIVLIVENENENWDSSDNKNNKVKFNSNNNRGNNNNNFVLTQQKILPLTVKNQSRACIEY